VDEEWFADCYLHEFLMPMSSISGQKPDATMVLNTPPETILLQHARAAGQRGVIRSPEGLALCTTCGHRRRRMHCACAEAA